MKRLIPHPLPDTPERLMIKAGYIRHCVEAGRACYHRGLNDPMFPRFHALVSLNDYGMEIDVHFDALDSISHAGNHDQPWAYEGERVDTEMRRVVETMCGHICVKKIYSPSVSPTQSPAEPTKRKRSLFDVLFKSM